MMKQTSNLFIKIYFVHKKSEHSTYLNKIKLLNDLLPIVGKIEIGCNLTSVGGFILDMLLLIWSFNFTCVSI